MITRISVTITILIFLTSSIFSKEVKVVRDFRIIGKLGVSKEFFKSWEIGLESTVKLEQDASRIDEIDFDLDVRYKPHRILVLGVGYRIAANKRKDDRYEQQQRLYGQAEFMFRVKQFKLEYRIRYQNVDDDFFQYNETTPTENILRNRLQFNYNIPKLKLTPYFYSEVYGELGTKTEFPTKIKFALGSRYSFGKYGKIKVYYRIDKQLNNQNPFIYYSLGIGYEYNF